MKPLAGARLIVVNPDPAAFYSGMLPGHIAGHYPRDMLEIDLVRLARLAGAQVVLGRVTAIDRQARKVHVTGRPPIVYDLLSLDIGVTSAMDDLPGFAEHAVPAKPLDRFADDWTHFVAAPPDVPRVCVIGGGVAGVELALAMAWRLRNRGPAITVVDAGHVLSASRPRTRRTLLARMRNAGITVIERAKVRAVTAHSVILADREIPSDFTLGTAGARPHGWLAETGLDLTDGFVTVDATLRSVTDPAVFAVGDCAHLSHAPRPKAGVFAVRAAPTLDANLRASLGGRPLHRFRPQGDYLKLISLGEKSALADKWGVALTGRALWRWKDRIDQRFMHRLGDLAPTSLPELPREHVAGLAEALGPKPLCSGCGAKVGGDALGEVLGGVGDDAAVLTIGDAQQVISTDHLRTVIEDPWVMARIAANHALGDIWAMGAKPQAALATVILPRLAPEIQTRWLAEIMTGAREVFDEAGAKIVGGHTSQGSELTIGFTVTGVASATPITLTDARPGDALLLTKPLGSGTILAAEMQLAARGEWVAGCLAEMQISQGGASRALARAHAMTDVTGFGLAGHLANILRASGVSARVDLAAVPLMPGAVELATAGIRSSLFEANLIHAFGAKAPSDPRAALLYDPQTSGGLLAAVAPEEAEGILTALGQAGYPAARIGTVTEGEPGIIA